MAPVGVAGGSASLAPPESETSSVARLLPIRLLPLKLCQARVMQSTRGDKLGERARKHAEGIDSEKSCPVKDKSGATLKCDSFLMRAIKCTL